MRDAARSVGAVVGDGLVNAGDALGDLEVFVFLEGGADDVHEQGGAASGEEPLDALERGEGAGAAIFAVREVAGNEACDGGGECEFEGALGEHGQFL